MTTSAGPLEAVVLAGGFGIRLRPAIGETPKPLAPVAGRPFLHYLLHFLARNGVERVVLAVHFGADTVRHYIGDGRELGMQVTYSVEQYPLGTGGGIRLAAAGLTESPVLVLNGDSFAEVDLGEMLHAHRSHRASYTLLCVNVPDASRYGRIKLDEDDRVIAFQEKGGGGAGLVNAGVYLLEQSIIRGIPSSPSSLEREVIPKFLGEGYGFTTSGFFVDIGTPEDYRRLINDPQPLLTAAQLKQE